ncbi:MULTISPECIES: glycosyltransferase family 2 protein [Cellulosimicrobium]|uniref:Glycosyltransferase family A protein n=1 Tax=Cellulosimicrobium sp. ES-005 TaxID=3163031 RepID=A0AAU8G2J2_9MICO|nr:glycosyltransferase family A protein [Cellulosimicrobium cellulans]MCO7274304.1 glycosyltransferase family 2 protein [Cellulosimicrobium cellulans]
MSPRVSVVVPAYNNGDYIAATMRSVLDQTFDDFELVVADHSSTDDTWEQLQAFAEDPRVRLVQTDAGGGARRNWNRVSELARGELIKLVCGDDLVHPTMLARQVAAIDAAGPEAVLVASQRDLVDARGDVFVRARGLGDLDGVVDGAEALRATVRSGTNLFGEPACVLMRTDALRRAGWWQDLRYYIDAGSYAHVMVQGRVVALRESLASFRVSASQWSVRLMRQQAEEAAEFHRLARELAPATITEQDVRRGDRLAKVVALQRRAAYVVLGRRMRPRD